MRYKLIFLICLIPAIVRADTVTLSWDVVDDVDGYRIYQTIRARNPDSGLVEHAYDFNNPLKIQQYPDGNIPQDVTSIEIVIPGVPEKSTKYMFTARAFRGETESPNSNEIAWVVNLIPPPAPVDLLGIYDPVESVIDLSWSQPEEPDYHHIDHWSVFYQSGEEWIELGSVDQNEELILSSKLSIVPEGEMEIVNFVVVAYRQSGAFSANSAELAVNIDRRGGVPPIENLRINVKMPVL